MNNEDIEKRALKAACLVHDGSTGDDMNDMRAAIAAYNAVMREAPQPEFEELLDKLETSSWDDGRASMADGLTTMKVRAAILDHVRRVEAETGWWATRAGAFQAGQEKAESERDAAIAELENRVQAWAKAHARQVKAEAERDAAIAERDAATVEIAKRIDAAIDAEIERDALAEKLQDIDSAIVSADENRHSALKAAAHLKAERDAAIAERDELARSLKRHKTAFEMISDQRDAAIAERQKEAESRQFWHGEAVMARSFRTRAEAERDAAIAEVERLRAELEWERETSDEVNR